MSDDQRAMLRLLAQREEGYEDIAALMGLSVDEVRARVREALAALDDGRSSAGPVAAGDPPPPAVAEASSGVVPPAAPPAEETPPPSTAEPRPSRPAAPSPPAAASLPRVRLLKERRRLIELVGGALIALLIVLFATGAVDIGGGDSESSTTTPSVAFPDRGITARTNSKLTQAILEPVDGGEASGRTLFGRVGKNVVLQVEAQGLDPSPPGQSYTVWLYRSPKLVLRIGSVKVGESGRLAAQLPIPAELLGFVASGAFDQIDVSLTPDAAYRAELAAARREKRLPGYIGTDILRGQITGPAIKQQ